MMVTFVPPLEGPSKGLTESKDDLVIAIAGGTTNEAPESITVRQRRLIVSLNTQDHIDCGTAKGRLYSTLCSLSVPSY